MARKKGSKKNKSHPTRGGWIEIQRSGMVDKLMRPTPHGVGGLKSAFVSPLHEFDVSHPTRGGWIEIKIGNFAHKSAKVPPHTGWVD